MGQCTLKNMHFYQNGGPHVSKYNNIHGRCRENFRCRKIMVFVCRNGAHRKNAGSAEKSYWKLALNAGNPGGLLSGNEI